MGAMRGSDGYRAARVTLLNSSRLLRNSSRHAQDGFPLPLFLNMHPAIAPDNIPLPTFMPVVVVVVVSGGGRLDRRCRGVGIPAVASFHLRYYKGRE